MLDADFMIDAVMASRMFGWEILANDFVVNITSDKLNVSDNYVVVSPPDIETTKLN